MRNLSELQEASSCFAMELQLAQEAMPFLELSEETDWPEVVEMFDHMKQIKRAIAMQTIEGSIAKWLTNAIDGHGVNEFYDSIKQFVRYFDYCYDIVNLFETKDMLEGFSLSRLLRKYRNCREYFAAMDAWIDYRDCKAICSQNGLHDFAIKAEDVWYPDGCLKDVFLKGFYYAWFESVCKNIDSVANFRVRTQESRVNSFRELDAHLLPVDQMRIREKLIRAMPKLRKRRMPNARA